MNTIQDLVQVVNLLEQIPNHPELLLSELRREKHGNNLINLMYDTQTKSGTILSVLENYLFNQSVFNDCVLKISRHNVIVSLKEKHGIPLHRIICIDLYDGTYSVYTGICDEIKQVLSKQYVFKEKELSDYWKQFENFNWNKRLSIAKRAVKRKCLKDVFFAFMISKEKVDRALNAEKKRLAILNDDEQSRYERLIVTQELYKKYGVDCIVYVNDRVDAISKWLQEKGFVKK